MSLAELSSAFAWLGFPISASSRNAAVCSVLFPRLLWKRWFLSQHGCLYSFFVFCMSCLGWEKMCQEFCRSWFWSFNWCGHISVVQESKIAESKFVLSCHLTNCKNGSWHVVSFSGKNMGSHGSRWLSPLVSRYAKHTQLRAASARCISGLAVNSMEP